jgi:GNAT superfamily N-acetyltransferase
MIEIRECKDSDFDGIFKLLFQLWPEMKLDGDILQKVFHDVLNMNDQFYFCALHDNKVVGFCSLSTRKRLGWQGTIANIDEMIVDEHHRGQGIGRALIGHVEENARSLGCTGIELDSALHRKEAHKFYEHLGFENRAHLFSKRL